MVSTDADLVCIHNITKAMLLHVVYMFLLNLLNVFFFFYYLLIVALGDPDTEIPQVPVPRERLHSPAR